MDDDEIEVNEGKDDHDHHEKLRKWAATCVVTYAAYAAFLCSLIRGSNYENDSSLEESDYERHSIITRLTKKKEEGCREQLRMGKNAFANLVYILKGRGLLRDTARSSVEEQVAKVLYIIGHNLNYRIIKFKFRRSSETISRHFHQVLRAIISLEDIFLKQPNGDECPTQIKDNQKFWPYFKISWLQVPPNQNVLVACIFDLMFTYVLPGWEGSASDSRILSDALTRVIDRLSVSQG
ncbi:hypothetical protein ACJIZ3_019881 [Penstemon smallii]|uniref:DUF8040 domain-containing protein n=1 Tax=Penstemon smallii TaxID=265156 RepID=A0ABD3T2G0_9LAMI